MSRFAIVARLTVARHARADFDAFERAAAAIMRAHGGRIEHTVVLETEADARSFDEVHIVTFPDATAWAAYRNDPALQALQPLRARAVLATRIEMGVEGPRYGE